MFPDADDLISAETLASLLEAARREPGSLAVCEWGWLRNEDGGWVEIARDLPLPDTNADAALRAWIETRCWSPTGSILWPADVYRRTGGWDKTLTLNDDGDLVMRALADGVGLVRASGGKFQYRDHGTSRISLSRTFTQEGRLHSEVRVIEKLAAALEQQGRIVLFAPSLAVAYQRTALVDFQFGNRELARECQRRARGEQLGGRRALSWAQNHNAKLSAVTVSGR